MPEFNVTIPITDQTGGSPEAMNQQPSQGRRQLPQPPPQPILTTKGGEGYGGRPHI